MKKKQYITPDIQVTLMQNAISIMENSTLPIVNQNEEEEEGDSIIWDVGW